MTKISKALSRYHEYLYQKNDVLRVHKNKLFNFIENEIGEENLSSRTVEKLDCLKRKMNEECVVSEKLINDAWEEVVNEKS